MAGAKNGAVRVGCVIELNGGIGRFNASVGAGGEINAGLSGVIAGSRAGIGRRGFDSARRSGFVVGKVTLGLTGAGESPSVVTNRPGDPGCSVTARTATGSVISGLRASAT